MTKKWKYISIGILLLTLAVSLVFNGYQLHQSMCKHDTLDVRVDSIRDTVYINLKDTLPKVVKPEVVVGSISIQIPPKEEYVKDSVVSSHVEDDVLRKDDSLYTFPIVQRTFGDSTYTAYVSGPKVDSVGPKLDSINMSLPVITNTITKTITVREQESPWSVSFQAGYGYGFLHKGFEPYVGIGFTYKINLFRKKKKKIVAGEPP